MVFIFRIAKRKELNSKVEKDDGNSFIHSFTLDATSYPNPKPDMNHDKINIVLVELKRSDIQRGILKLLKRNSPQSLASVHNADQLRLP